LYLDNRFCIPFDAVIVHKLDRFARNRGDSIGYRMHLKRHEVSLISVLEYLDDESPESIILESVLEAMAEYYSLNLAREVRKGLTENALKGIHTGGKPPLGYDVDPTSRKLVINEYEAQAIRLIFQRVLEGVGYSAIIQELTQKGYKTKVGNLFGKNSIHAILVNEKYTGTYIFNKSAPRNVDGKRNSHAYKDESEIIRLENFMPAIIPKDLFSAVAEAMKKRKHIPQNIKGQEVYLLSGKIICGICGCTYVGNRNKDGRNKALQVRYGCNKRHRQPTAICNNKEIRREYIEAFVLERLGEHILDDSLIPHITEYYNCRIQLANNETNLEIMNLHKQKKEIARQLENIINVISNTGSNALVAKLSELEDEQREINSRIACLDSVAPGILRNEDVAEAFHLARELITCKSLPALKKLVHMFVDKVIIYPDRVDVYFNFCKKKNPPQPPSDDQRSTMSPLVPALPPRDGGKNVVTAGGPEGS